MSMLRRHVTDRCQGKNFDEIAAEVGYGNRGTAYEAVRGALQRNTIEDINEIRDVEIGRRLDAMVDSIWPVAIGAPFLVEDEDEKGNPIRVVTLPKTKLDAIDKMIKLMERRSRFLGLDHQDGLME